MVCHIVTIIKHMCECQVHPPRANEMPAHQAKSMLTSNAMILMAQYNTIPPSAATPTTPPNSTMPDNIISLPMLPLTQLTTPMSPSQQLLQRSKMTCRNADNVPSLGTSQAQVPPNAPAFLAAPSDSSMVTCW